jgi:DNA-binding transcriptional MocR family regulator
MAVYHDIADDLRRQIADSTLAPGAQLPSFQELAARYCVSTYTIQRSIKLLTREGGSSAFTPTPNTSSSTPATAKLDRSLDSATAPVPKTSCPVSSHPSAVRLARVAGRSPRAGVPRSGSTRRVLTSAGPAAESASSAA